MEPMRQEIVVDYPNNQRSQALFEVEDRSAFDSAVGVVVGLALGLISWGLIAAVWLTLL